jgi:Flp pilus assembly protein TadG
MMMRLRRRSRGQVLVVFAVSAVALFAVAALAIDGGRILIDQRALQNAIDGAALNGAIDIGPGASATQSATAQDDAINNIEQALGISFSSTYSTYGPHHLAGGCGGAACQPPYAAGSINWTDNSGTYKVTVTTPFTFGSSGDREAFIRIHITHTFTLMIGATIFPTLPINADVVARNYALPYSLYMLKWYDPNDYQQNGSTILQANKNMGTNGSLSRGGGASMTYYCSKLPSNLYGYGGDLHEYDVQTLASSGITPNSIKSSCFSDTPFPGSGTPGSTTTSIALQAPPPVRLPPDPYGSAAAPAPINVTVSGTQMLQPTIPGTVGGAYGPRYGTVSVPNMATLILQSGVYFFEGTASGSGLQIQSGGQVETGDCYGYALPNCWIPGSGNPAICASGVQNPSTVTLAQLGSVPGSFLFPCPKDGDFGVLLVFYPHGTDSSVACISINPLDLNLTHQYCPYDTTAPSGNDNQLRVQASSSNIYTTSSPKYHNVVVYVDPNHEQGTLWNYTSSVSLSLAGCVTSTCAMQIGVGSQVVYSNGGGNISIIGAILAPDDNVEIGGGSSGKGYGQILAYTLYIHGNGTVNELYNPLSLAYEPVIVR